MKKFMNVIAAVALLACVATLSVSCTKSNKKSKKAKNANEIVIFDPAKTAVDVGEVVTVGKSKFLKVTVDGYGTSIVIPGVDCNGKNTFEAECYAEEANEILNLTLALKDETYADISNPAMYQLKDAPETVMAMNADKQPWNTLSETRICSVIQPMVQDSTDGYREQYGVVIYIGKITAK